MSFFDGILDEPRILPTRRFVEKGNLEVLLFTLKSKMRANNQRPYTPREGLMIADINRAWEK